MRASDPHPRVEGQPTRRRAEQGTAFIEFALVLPFLLILTLCVIDVSRAFFAKNVAAKAAREGARTAVLYSAALAPESARARAQKVVDADAMTMTACTFQDLGDRQWQVTVSVQCNLLNPGIFGWFDAGFTNPMTLTSSAVMRREGP
jgi:Flp pilus assembly protein TadG